MFCIPLYLPYRFFLSFSMALCAKVLQFLTKLRFAPRNFLVLLSHFGGGLSIICFYVRVWHNGKTRRCGRKPAMPGFAIRYSCRLKAPLEGSSACRKVLCRGAQCAPVPICHVRSFPEKALLRWIGGRTLFAPTFSTWQNWRFLTHWPPFTQGSLLGAPTATEKKQPTKKGRHRMVVSPFCIIKL